MNSNRQFLKATGFASLFAATTLALTGCSAVKFSTKSGCGNNANCVSGQGVDSYQDTITVRGGKVDLLIVNDNSASMSYEQARLAQRLNQFVAQFDQRQIEYRMATTTTDISSSQNPARTVNQNGALQDGKLISFSNGAKFLTPESGTPVQKEQMFNQAINRSETYACEQFISNWISSGKSRETSEYAQAYYNSCPSTDERGIYAANLVVKNNPDSFIRADADLHVIFLADEDERSELYRYNAAYALEDYDTGDKLLTNIRAVYPQKTVGLHAIIVKDAGCLSQQGSQLSGIVSGSYGWQYHNATLSTQGVSGDICATDYTQQLSSIFNNIQGQIVDKIALNCAAPQLEIENITISSSDSTIVHQIVGAEIRFNKKLPVGSTVSYRYKCRRTAQ